MSHFDNSAKTWDNNPMHWERSKAIAEKILHKMPLQPDMRTMEYGAGTGILSFLLKDSVKEIVLMDSSREMVSVIEKKIRKENLTHLKPLFFDLETADYPSENFDFIFTQMVLHHVADVDLIISKFYSMLNKGGSIAIADLYSEDGTFHSDGFTGHLGFDAEDLGRVLSKSGFENISHELCFVIRKQIISGEMKDFPVFFITAIKK